MATSAGCAVMSSAHAVTSGVGAMGPGDACPLPLPPPQPRPLPPFRALPGGGAQPAKGEQDGRRAVARRRPRVIRRCGGGGATFACAVTSGGPGRRRVKIPLLV
ncbi:unnamed protein product [Eretmochelys imbricata]